MIEKEWSGQKSRRLSVINPSAEGSQTLVFRAETSEELEDWLDALHQHLFDQSECVSANDADVFEKHACLEQKRMFEKQSGELSGQIAHLLSHSLSPALAEHQASGSTAATS